MCYTIPLAGAIITSAMCKKTKSLKLWWLNLMFYGGAIFGVIDHLWNKELFLISENTAKDLLLGVIITVSIVISWIFILILVKANLTLPSYITVKR